MQVVIVVCALVALNSGYETDLSQFSGDEYVRLPRKTLDSEELENFYNQVFGDSPVFHPLGIYFPVLLGQRKKRSADTNTDSDLQEKLKIAAQIEADIVKKHLGKPLELLPMESDNVTASNETETISGNETVTITTEPVTSLNFTDSGNDVLVLNDFIRFKRGLEEQANTEADSGRTKREHDRQEKNEKMLTIPESNREPRGAMKEQWIKQPYPVQMPQESNYNDNIPASSDNIRAPRVHFVTHRVSESTHMPSIYRSFDRDGRSRDFDKDFVGDLSKDIARDMDREYSFRSGYRMEPSHSYRYNRYEPSYFSDDYSRDRRYYPRYDHHDRYYSPERNDQYSYSNRQQKRIVYYATLPEVVRSPTHADFRDRFAYNDRYDDRYNSPSDRYRYYRKPSYTSGKSRYDSDMEGSKTPYPLKVSTDVNVSEIKKNPERRIYSESDRRYAPKAQAFQAEDGSYNSQQ